MNDAVNHPSHYADSCSLECFQVMLLIFGRDAVINFCLCNAFKYMWRYKNKNGQEDLDKAEWYLDKAESMTVSNTALGRLQGLLGEIKGE